LDIADKIQDGTLQGEKLKGNFQGFYALYYQIGICYLSLENFEKAVTFFT